MDIILAAIFCYQLHRMASMRGLAPWPYVFNYIAIFMLGIIALVGVLMNIFGVEAFQGEQQVTTFMSLAPFTILFEVFLFIFFRKRIQRTTPTNNDNDDYNRPEPPKEKKDLSYFR